MVSASGSCTCSSVSTVVISSSLEFGGAETLDRADGPVGAEERTGVELSLSTLSRVLLMISISVARVDI